MAKSVLIENPISSCTHVNMNRARRHVNKGRAEWAIEGVSIRFLPKSHQHRAVVVTIEKTKRELTLEKTEADYDCASDSGLASEEAMRGLPMTGDVINALMIPSAPPRNTLRMRLKSRIVMLNGQQLVPARV